MLAKTRFVVNAERSPQTYQWEGHGLNLRVSRGTAASFSIEALWSSKFKLPKKTELVSPVYWVLYDGKVEGPVGVELQHYSRIRRYEVGFAVCKVEKAEPPYQFELCEGQFSKVSSYGRLEVESSSTLLAVIMYRDTAYPEVPMFQARLYHHQQQQSTTDVYIVIVPKHEMSTKVRAVQKLLYSHTLLYVCSDVAAVL